jgi:hypothetical protein
MGNSIFTTQGNSIDWNGEMWVAVGVGTNTIAFSHGSIITGLGTDVFSTSGNSIKWCGNKWLAGGDDSTGTNKSIVYSLNGNVWRDAASNLSTVSSISFTDKGDNTLLFPRSRMLAAGTGTPTLSISYDEGETWSTINNTIFTSAIGSYFYGNKCVAVGAGTNDTIAFSRNGALNFVGIGKKIFSTQGNGVVRGSNIWVAVGEGTNTLAYSYDGYTWFGLGLSIFSTNAKAVAWNGIQFVAVGAGTNSVAYSSDGITWIGKGVSLLGGVGTCVVWGNNTWVAGGSAATVILSSNGIDWENGGTMTGATSIAGIEWSGNIHMAVGAGTNKMWYSTMGYSWDIQTNPITTPSGIKWNGVRFVYYGAGTNNILHSTSIQLTNNIATGNIAATTVNHISWNNSNIGVVELTPTILATSTTLGTTSAGATYMAISQEPYKWNKLVKSALSSPQLGSTGFNGISWDGERWFVGGVNDSKIITSTNSVDWTLASDMGVDVPSYSATADVKFVKSNRSTVIICANGTTSTDAILRSTNKGTLPVLSTGFAFKTYARVVECSGEGANAIWIAGGNSDAGTGVTYSLASSSDDGITWTPRDNVIFLEVFDIIYVSGRWFACGLPAATKQPIAVSDDNGVTWTEIAGTSAIITGQANSLIWNGTRIVVVGHATGPGNGIIAYCDNYNLAAGSVTFSAGTTVVAFPALGGTLAGNRFIYADNNFVLSSVAGTNFEEFFAGYDTNSRENIIPQYGGITSSTKTKYVNSDIPRVLTKGDTITVYSNRYSDSAVHNIVNISFKFD